MIWYKDGPPKITLCGNNPSPLASFMLVARGSLTLTNILKRQTKNFLDKDLSQRYTFDILRAMMSLEKYSGFYSRRESNGI